MAVYYESSWSILSTIGLVNFFFAWIVIGITRLSWLSAIPAIVSAAGAVANGLCYYAWYMNSGKPRTATAYAVADILWMLLGANCICRQYRPTGLEVDIHSRFSERVVSSDAKKDCR
ncbi:hypothetical protein QSH57_002973 [Fusarium oxysporum f. sp. vasinfectum]|nr:hypothetical protein QSH57_002973 [Fusarium oxysporum f. sp. vasinfectum]